MSGLIEELKKEHIEIVDALKEADELSIISDEGQAKLLSVKAGLLAHLAKEDEQLYPVLRKESANNKELESTLDVCASEMENVTKTALEFFDKYSKGVLDMEYESGFKGLLESLNTRIKKEESILYAEFEKINQ